MKRILLLILTIALTCTLLAAPPEPNPKLNELQYFVGHWTCKGTAFPFMGMPEHKTHATIDGAWVMNNHWLQFHYTESETANNPAPVEVQYHWGWNEQTKTFASSAVDNGGGHFVQDSPGWDGDKITFEGDMHIGGTTMRFHDVFTKVGDSSLVHKGEAVIEGKWTKLDEETCSR